MYKNKITLPKNKSRGFAIIEIIIGIVLIGVIAVGIFVSKNPEYREAVLNLSPTPIGSTSSPSPTPEYIPTTYPTNTPLETETTDQTVNLVSSDLNELEQELNQLDQVSQELDLPSVDFSTDEL